jgi:hypothetical protein
MMDKAKRQRLEPDETKPMDVDDPRMRELMPKGKPLEFTLLDATKLVPLLQSLSDDELTKGYRAEQLAFATYYRIQIGEIARWPCTLCGRKFRGHAQLSALGVVDRTFDNPTSTTPAIVAPVCRSCTTDSEGTWSRVRQALGCAEVQTGRA